jgi:hypothetical protein
MDKPIAHIHITVNSLRSDNKKYYQETFDEGQAIELYDYNEKSDFILLKNNDIDDIAKIIKYKKSYYLVKK